MKKKSLRILTLIILVVFGLEIACQNGKVNASTINQNNINFEEKKICNVTLEDDFADDRVIVVLNKIESSQFKEYNVNSFPNIECYEVEDLTSLITEKIKNQQDGKAKINDLNNNIVNVDDFRQILKLKLVEKGKENVIKAIRELEKRNDVISVGPDYFGSIQSTTPNDAYLSEQWAINKMNLKNAWDISTGSSSIKVGVMDSGIDADHPDLTNRVDRVLSRSFCSDNPTPLEDSVGHGTHVAGIIGSQGNNTIGVTGACWNISLVSLKVADINGGIPMSSMISAVNYATQQNIPVLNCSITFKGYNSDLYYAIKIYTGIFVCAAGNSGANTDLHPESPAGFDSDNIISVGSSNINDEISFRSNFGKSSVDVFAPGENILSTYPLEMCQNGTHDIINTNHIANGYHTTSGTSMSSPYVAGVIALLLSKYPYLKSSAVKDIILDNVDKVINQNGNSSFGNYCVSGGRLNAYKVLYNFRPVGINTSTNILPYLNYGQGKFVFSNYGSQFIKLTLEATKSNGTIIYPEGAIVVRNSSGQIIKKCDSLNYSNNAESDDGINNLTVFLPQSGYYYIDINYSDPTITSLNLSTISIVSDSTSIDAFDYGESEEFEMNMILNGTKGDALKTFSLQQAGKYQINLNNSDNLSNYVLLVLLKRDSTSAFAGLQVVEARYINGAYTLSVNISSGTYYIGYFDNLNNSTISINMKRLITQYGGNLLWTDYERMQIAGSEVTLNGGVRGQTTITEGFTRIIYFDPFSSDTPSTSRLDYYWYSSNPDVATVSEYGTVTAMPVNYDKAVKIMAVYKNDSSKVFIKQFTIKNETKSSPIYINHSMTVKVNSSSFINLNNIIVPINLLQLYNWTSDSIYQASVDYWGNVCGHSLGIATITGRYYYNSRVIIIIEVRIIP